MQQLKQSTQVKVRVGPAMDPTDGVTPVTGLTLGAADQAELLKHDGAATVDISSNTFAAVTGADGWYDLTLTSSDVGTLGMLTVVIQDASACLPIFSDFMVVPSEWYAGGVDGTEPFATSSQLDQIGIGSSSISKIADSVTVTTGTPTGTITDAQQLDGLTYDVAPSGGILDFYFEFDLGPNNTASLIDWSGYVNTQNDLADVFAWDWNGAAWTQIGSRIGTSSTTVQSDQWNLDTRHTGTSANAGKVRVRFESSGGDVVTNVSTDQILCSYAVTSQSVGYANGSIWMDTINGTSGTTDYFNGTADNPSDNLADALTLAGSVGLARITVSQSSSMTFVQTMNNLAFIGLDYVIALGGQQVDSSSIIGAVVSGTATGNGGSLLFEKCKFGNATLPEVAIVDSALAGTITASEAGLYFFKDCASAIAGSGAPVFDFGAAVGNTQLNFRHYSGGIELQNMKAGDTMSLEGDGQFIINSNCTGGSISVRGNFKKTDNSGLVTIDETANTYNPAIVTGRVVAATSNTVTLNGSASTVDGAYDPAVVLITGGTGVGQSRMILEYDGLTKVATVDRNWKTNPDTTSDYSVLSNPGREHVNEGNMQAGTSTTATLNANASSSDDAYINQTIFIRSGTGDDQARRVSDYNGTTKVATVSKAWDVTPDSTSGYVMLPTSLVSPDELLDIEVEDNGQGTTWTLKGVLRALFSFNTGYRTGGGAAGSKAFGVPGSSPNKVRVAIPTDSDGNSTGDSTIDVTDA